MMLNKSVFDSNSLSASGNLSELCSIWLSEHNETSSIVQRIHQRPSSLTIWCVGMACVTLVSLCAIVGIFFVRGLSKKNYDRFITIFVAVGVGSLITSSTLHLIPQGLGIIDGNNFDFITVELFAILGIYIFFYCDKLLKISLESKKLIDAEVNSTRDANASIYPTSSEALMINGSTCTTSQNIDFSVAYKQDKNDPSLCKAAASIDASDVDMARQAHGICVHDHEINFNQNKDSAIKTVAWMIIFGDGLHNFIDGVSIGAALNESLISGLSVSLAVLAEEFPHELGDVAILLNSGMTLKQTLFYNILSTLTCFIGFIIGALLGSIDSFLRYVFGFSGGMFLYIALSCMMPEMKKTMEDALKISHYEALSVLSLQTIGLAIGTSTMFFFARYGDLLQLA